MNKILPAIGLLSCVLFFHPGVKAAEGADEAAQPASVSSDSVRSKESAESVYSSPRYAAWRQRLALQSFNEEMAREHAGRVQARADAEQRARQTDSARDNQIERRYLMRQGGNNQDGNQSQSGTEVQRAKEAEVVSKSEQTASTK